MYKTKKNHIKSILLRQRLELLKTIASEEELDYKELVNKYSDIDSEAYKRLFIDDIQSIGVKIYDKLVSDQFMSNKNDKSLPEKKEFLDVCLEFANEIIGKNIIEEEVNNYINKKIEMINNNKDNDNKYNDNYYFDKPSSAYSKMRELNKDELEKYNKENNTGRKRISIWGVYEIGENEITGRKFIVERKIDGKKYGDTGTAMIKL